MLLDNKNKWCYANLDLVEEIIETGNKPIVMVCGASSSGKSYCSNILKSFFEEKGFKTITISTDDYSKGISKIIFDATNSKYYNGLLENKEKIVEIIKEITINTGFSYKLCDENLEKLSLRLKDYINHNEISYFLKHLKFELDNINFDKVSNYDLKLLSSDINELSNGKNVSIKNYSKITGERQESGNSNYNSDFDIIIIEGIYALNSNLTKRLNENVLVKNFIDCDDKSLFIRRILRDLKGTSCDKKFIIKNYLKFVAKEYFKTVLPSKDNADIILQNNMSFDELRNGEFLENQLKYKINKEDLQDFMRNAVVVSKIIQRDTYLFCDKKSTSNILRLREVSYGNDFLMENLVHKGECRIRKDKKLIRPVNIIANQHELYEMFSSKYELINELKEVGINNYKVITKQRVLINYYGENIKVDKINNQYYIEFENEENTKLVSLYNLEKVNSYLENFIENQDLNVNSKVYETKKKDFKEMKENLKP